MKIRCVAHFPILRAEQLKRANFSINHEKVAGRCAGIVIGGSGCDSWKHSIFLYCRKRNVPHQYAENPFACSVQTVVMRMIYRLLIFSSVTVLFRRYLIGLSSDKHNASFRYSVNALLTVRFHWLQALDSCKLIQYNLAFTYPGK